MNTPMIDLSIRYQLPTIFSRENASNEYRIFVFKDATDASVRESAKKVDEREEIGKVTVYCETGHTEEAVQRYASILDETISDTRDIEILIEPNISSDVLHQMFWTIHAAMTRRYAILN